MAILNRLLALNLEPEPIFEKEKKKIISLQCGIPQVTLYIVYLACSKSLFYNPVRAETYDIYMRVSRDQTLTFKRNG